MRKTLPVVCASPDCCALTAHVSRLCAACRERRDAQFAAEDALGDAMATGLGSARCQSPPAEPSVSQGRAKPDTDRLYDIGIELLQSATEAMARQGPGRISTACDDQHGSALDGPEAPEGNWLKAVMDDQQRRAAEKWARGEMEATGTLGRKDDAIKPRLDLLVEGMPRALQEVARVLTFGSLKYAGHNWLHVDHAPQRYLAAGMRHELALATGETYDPETGAHHLAHKLCCDLFQLELALRGEESTCR